MKLHSGENQSSIQGRIKEGFQFLTKQKLLGGQVLASPESKLTRFMVKLILNEYYDFHPIMNSIVNLVAKNI